MTKFSESDQHLATCICSSAEKVLHSLRSDKLVDFALVQGLYDLLYTAADYWKNYESVPKNVAFLFTTICENIRNCKYNHPSAHEDEVLEIAESIRKMIIKILS